MGGWPEWVAKTLVVGRVEEVDILDRSQVRRPSGLLYALGALETGRGRLRTAQVY